MEEKAKIAVIGGSGVYKMEGAKVVESLKIDTPYGKPSDEIVIADVEGKRVAFLPRHGVGHRYLPTEIPVKANIYALKKLGVRFIVAVSAVGSLRENIAPRDFVIPSQIIDRTKSRENSFFGDGIVGHVAFAEPFCPYLSNILYTELKDEGLKVHKDATYVCMEGPLFSTKAESNLYRSFGGDIIGMTALPEAKLAREAEISYGMIAMSTDYDCWHTEHDSVTLDMVIANASANASNVKAVLPKIVSAINENEVTVAHEAAKFAVMTAPSCFPEETKSRLSLFYGKYWDK